MTTSEIFSLIGSYGFPIVMCFVLIWFMYKVLKEFGKTLSDLKLSTDKNSELIDQLIKRIDKGEK